MRPKFPSGMLPVFVFALCLMLVPTAAFGHGSGITGRSTSGCNSCHSGGSAPTVAITGPTSVASGSTNTYTLTVSGGAGVVGGLDVSHSVGTFVAVDSGTTLSGVEITHNAPRNFSGNSASWTFNWTAPAVASATAATLYGAGLSADGDGGSSGDAGATASLGITVNPAGATAPSITSQPASQTVTAGQTATFTAVAAGTAPLSYQWKKNGAAITGATSAAYTTPAATVADNGATFAVTVTNSAGSATSANATLTVNAAAAAPSITTQPASQSVAVGQTATFTVAASGTAPLTYQWKKNGAAITGATLASYTTPATTAADNGATFAVTVTNSLGSATSGSATLTVTAAPQVPASSHVVLLVLEHHAYSSVIGNSLMPYLNALANRYGLATQYYANAHPGIPNYFMLTAGQTETGDPTMTPATLPVADDNLVRELLTAGKTWKAYVEGLPSVGYTGASTASYVAANNPFAYFTDVSNSAAQKLNLVPFTQFATDRAAGQLPNFSYLKPNVMNDGGDGTLDAADLWLQQNIAPLLATAAFQTDGLLVITFDESVASDTGHGGGQVATIVISPRAVSGYRSSSVYQHPSVLRTMLAALGVSSFPGAAATAAPMAEFFSASANTTPPAVPGASLVPVAPFTMSAPTTMAGTHGQPMAINVTISPQNGFNGPVTLSCSGLPAGASYSWSANPVAPINGAVSSTLTITVPAGSASLHSVPGRRLDPLFGLMLPVLGVALGSGLLGRRRKTILWLVFALALLLLLAGVGCGSSSGGVAAHTASAQSFTVTVTGTSGTATATQTIAVTLN